MADRNEAPWWVILLPCWGVGLFLLVAYIHHAGWFPSPPQSFFEVFFLLLAIVLLLIPFATKVKLLNVFEIQRDLKKTRSDLEAFKSDTRQLFALIANVRASAAASNTTNVYNAPPDEGRKDAPVPQKPEPSKDVGGAAPTAAASAARPKRRTAIEYKILNTLWNKQVEKFPSLQARFTFRINSASPEFLAFREAGNRLLGEGLINETDQEHFVLTDCGLRFCAENYSTFPEDMWFNRVSLDPKNLADAKTLLGVE